MAWESGFFNSNNGDRLYNADKFNEIFEGLISDGVFESIGNKLAVEPNSGMVIQVATGRGWFNNHWVRNTSEKLITLEGADSVLNRYGAVIVKVDSSTAVRDVTCEVKYSEFAVNPAKPTMARGELINEYCLAYVYIPAKATSIGAENIEDTRSDSDLCGWVTGLIEQLDAKTLYTQFTEIFNNWFNGLVDDLDPNTEAMLVNSLPASVELSLLEDNWSGTAGEYTQTVQVVNMTPTKTVLVQGIDSDTITQAKIECISQGANSLTFKSQIIPSGEVKVSVTHFGR